MTHRFEIEKRHWGRYHIVRAKSHQYKDYGMGGSDKHEIGEYEKGKRANISISQFLERVASVAT